MVKSKYTDELKQEVLKAAEPYLIQGWNLRTIHKQLEAEYQNEGKEMISWWSFYPLAKAMLEELKAEGKIGADGANTANLSDKSDQSDGSDSAESEEPSKAAEEPDEAAEEAEEDQGEDPETEDDGGEYVRTLEDMLRLYRRRTEADVDAVCDRLLPGLLADEE